MQIGFEVTAAKPKGLRATEEQPAQTPMRPREIAKNPTTDQKKVRRQIQRSAAMNDVGDCRLCGGDLEAVSHDGETMSAKCAECGTKHDLQDAYGKTATRQEKLATFQNLSEVEQSRIRTIAWWHEDAASCPHCQAKGVRGVGFADSNQPEAGGLRMMMHCDSCGQSHQVPAQRFAEDDHEFAGRQKRYQNRPEQHGVTSSLDVAALLPFVGAHWVPQADSSAYTARSGMSAIARRAQSVLDTEEIL